MEPILPRDVGTAQRQQDALASLTDVGAHLSTNCNWTCLQGASLAVLHGDLFTAPLAGRTSASGHKEDIGSARVPPLSSASAYGQNSRRTSSRCPPGPEMVKWQSTSSQSFGSLCQG